ncbi:hypothetical protein CEP51_015205 [Fusarium floridanum]|uniref:Uncharacterized protein n=2 Tax=Fusarium solani species complex TaxID=232080 RepID=A0A428PEH7_9HYPO|nr:hypothetical protein CEP51_015205 [Fusarium floridanum]RSM15051.1 hypothetical protein CDV31_005131 [Fusarium ambrosium]
MQFQGFVRLKLPIYDKQIVQRQIIMLPLAQGPDVTGDWATKDDDKNKAGAILGALRRCLADPYPQEALQQALNENCGVSQCDASY